MFDFSAVLKGPRKSVPPLKEQKVRAGERSDLDFDRCTLCRFASVPHFLHTDN